MDDSNVHMAHCNMDDYRWTCKYGEDETCPALNGDRHGEEKISLFSLEGPIENAIRILNEKPHWAKLEVRIQRFDGNTEYQLWVVW